MRKHRQYGFTLIELLIGSLLLVVLTLLVNNILFNVFKGTAKSEVLKEVKQNGDYALSVMERMIREAKEVESCSGSELSIINQDPDDPDKTKVRHKTTFKCMLDSGVLRIASSSALPPIAIGDRMLTSSENVTLTGASCPGTLSFTCSQATGKVSQVEIRFTLRQKTAAGVTPRKEEQAEIPFQTTVSLRNY